MSWRWILWEDPALPLEQNIIEWLHHGLKDCFSIDFSGCFYSWHTEMNCCSSPNVRALRAAACFVACLGQPRPVPAGRGFALAKIWRLYLRAVSTLPALFGAGLYPSSRIFLRDRLYVLVPFSSFFTQFSTPFLVRLVSPRNFPVPRFSVCVSPFRARYLYAFISFTFQGWIRYRSGCSGRTPGALVKTIKYSKFRIILGSASKKYQIFEISNYFRYSSI